MPHQILHELLNFDIDRYLNPYIPHNRLYIFPRPIQRFLGYRATPQQDAPVLLQWVFMYIFTVAGLCLVSGLYTSAPGIRALHPPVIASFGASAILDYNAIRVPLAQPRNTIIGHTLSAIVGVGVARLFALNHPFFEEYAWVAGAVACATASLVMSMTGTVHPPGGATAVLACTNAQVVALGWWFVPLVMLGVTLMTCVALIGNNICRQYPMYWWTPGDCGRKLRKGMDVEGGGKLEKQDSSERTLRDEDSDAVDGYKMGSIAVDGHEIHLPEYLNVTEDEMAVLEKLRERMRACKEAMD